MSHNVKLAIVSHETKLLGLLIPGKKTLTKAGNLIHLWSWVVYQSEAFSTAKIKQCILTAGWKPSETLLTSYQKECTVHLHLSDAFIQCNLQSIRAIQLFISMCVPWELNPQPFCTANAMLCHWATGATTVIPGVWADQINKSYKQSMVYVFFLFYFVILHIDISELTEIDTFAFKSKTYSFQIRWNI